MTSHFLSQRQQKPAELALTTDRQFFRCLREQGPMSRAAISQQTGVSRPTISEAAQRLVNQSLVIETKRKTKNRQGRAGIIYEINASRGVCIGVALDGERFQVRVTDFAQNIIAEQVCDLNQTLSADQLIGKLLAMVENAASLAPTPVLSVGISIADPVNTSTGQVISLPNSPFPLAHNIDFVSLFSGIYHCPVVIDNDVNWATLAEKEQGNAQEESHFLFFYFGRGIGAGIYLADRLVRGGIGMAGEVGYFKVDGETNLQDFVKEKELEKALKNNNLLVGHPAIEQIVHVITSTAIVLNPNKIVLGGPLSQHKAFMEALTAPIKKNSFVKTEIVASAMPNTAPLCGATLGAYDLALCKLGLQEPLD